MTCSNVKKKYNCYISDVFKTPGDRALTIEVYINPRFNMLGLFPNGPSAMVDNLQLEQIELIAKLDCYQGEIALKFDVKQ